MRILFAIQGTGNGHISRAREVIPHLQRHGQVDLLISGTQADVGLPYELRYRLHGFSFIFGKKGGVDRLKTFRVMNTRQLWHDIRQLPVHDYDLILNDFEPVTAWACRVQKKRSVALSHQCAFLSPKTPRPQSRHYSEWIFRYYAPATHHIGFHFERYDHFIHTPVIRSEIRNLAVEDKGHYTAYLPAYDDRLLLSHLNRTGVPWQVFSKHAKKIYTERNVQVFPVQNELYNKSVAASAGLVTGGGFEAPAEAFFMGKKLMVIPMSGQYEQQCNALSAENTGAVRILRIGRSFPEQLENWMQKKQTVRVNYPDETGQIIEDLISRFVIAADS